jgi:hypothetical protein
MTAQRRRWRTIVDEQVKNHASEPATFRWIRDQPEGTRVRVETTEGDRWVWFESVKVLADGGIDTI